MSYFEIFIFVTISIGSGFIGGVIASFIFLGDIYLQLGRFLSDIKQLRKYADDSVLLMGNLLKKIESLKPEIK